MRSVPQSVRFVAASQPDLSDDELVLAKQDYAALLKELAAWTDNWSGQAPVSTFSPHLDRFDFLLLVSDPNTVHVIRRGHFRDVAAG